MNGHSHDLAPFRHSHVFADDLHGRRRQALGAVVLLTLVTMAVELVAGWWTGSLALTADGWHMGTHALALGGAWAAYQLSARAASHAGYAFGGWKIEVLAGYTSALLLMGAALWIAVDALLALQTPRQIAYAQAALVATVGLLVNLASMWLLMRGDKGQGGPADPHHAHQHDDPGDHHHHDHNFRAAALHVLADALTSVLALAALAGGALGGWAWLDPVVAMIGAAVIAQWSYGMLRSSARALVDATVDPALARAIHKRIEADGDAKIADLHVWQVGGSAWCAALSVVADQPLAAAAYRERLNGLDRLRHVTVEVHRCQGGPESPV